jgi:hypothetical protein
MFLHGFEWIMLGFFIGGLATYIACKMHFQKTFFNMKMDILASLTNTNERLMDVANLCKALQEQLNLHESRSIQPEAFYFLKSEIEKINDSISTAKASKSILSTLQHRVSSIEAMLNAKHS